MIPQVIICALIVGQVVSGAAASAQTVAITNVSIVSPADGSVRRGMTVLVQGGWITEVDSSGLIEVPDDVETVHGWGKYLIPGLWDMHVHTGSDRNAREIVYPLMIAHGVTGIRNMSGDCLDCGAEYSVDAENTRRRAVAAGELLGPRIVASSDFAGSHEQASRRKSEGSSPSAPGTAADARAFARLSAARGAEFIKIYDMLPRSAYFALVEEAGRLGLSVAGHVPVYVRASEASDAGQTSIEHPRQFGILLECSAREEELRRRLIEEFERAGMGERYTAEGPAILPLLLELVDSYDSTKCAELAERLVQNGTRLVPTLMVGRLPSELDNGWRDDPYVRFLTEEEYDAFEWAEGAIERDLGDAEAEAPVRRWERRITGMMNELGVEILAGSDAGAVVFWGVGLHRELELLVRAGLTEVEALRSATLSPAEFLQATDSLGTIEVGKVADMVLLDANPLDDIRNTQRIHAVVIRGEVLDRAALDLLMADAERAAQTR